MPNEQREAHRRRDPGPWLAGRSTSVLAPGSAPPAPPPRNAISLGGLSSCLPYLFRAAEANRRAAKRTFDRSAITDVRVLGYYVRPSRAAQNVLVRLAPDGRGQLANVPIHIQKTEITLTLQKASNGRGRVPSIRALIERRRVREGHVAQHLEGFIEVVG